MMGWIILLALVAAGLLSIRFFFSEEKKLFERFFKEISNDTTFSRLLNVAKEENIAVEPISRILGGEGMSSFLAPPRKILITTRLIKNYLAIEKKISMPIETVRFIFAHELGHCKIVSVRNRLIKECSFFRKGNASCLLDELLACREALAILEMIEGIFSLHNYRNSWILWFSPALYEKQCKDCFKKVVGTKICPKADEIKIVGTQIEEMLGI